jgi:hypothetical protein
VTGHSKNKTWGKRVRRAWIKTLLKLVFAVSSCFAQTENDFFGQRLQGLTFADWNQIGHWYANMITPQLQLPAPWTTEENLHFVIPEGARLENLPTHLEHDTVFGSASIRYERHGRELTISTLVQFRKLRIEPEEYNAFRAFCSQVEKAFHQEIKVRLAS